MLDPLNPWDLTRIVIGVDPAVTHGEGSDDTGIIVAGLGKDGHGYVLQDLTCHLSPEGWAKEVVKAYHHWQADRVVAESNQGGQLVETVLRTQEQNLPIRLVHARESKRTRAEPVAALYEQGKVHHVGGFSELEDELCVAGGTLVTTFSGPKPIEDISAGEIVATRSGWKPVLWAGQTGTAACVTVRTRTRELRCTYAHPVWVEGRGFVAACEVEPANIVMTWLSPSSATTSNMTASNTSAPSSVLGGSIGTRRVWPPTAVGGPFYIEFCTQRRTVLYPTTAKSIIAMGTGSTTTSPILKPSHAPGTSLHTGRVGHGLARAMRRATSLVRCGRNENHGPSNASGAVESSRVLVCEPCSAPERVVAVTTPASGAIEPVYNLTVEDEPEFFANGILVHNCMWVPGESDSPDRLDALVWALTELMLGGSASLGNFMANPDASFLAGYRNAGPKTI